METATTRLFRKMENDILTKWTVRKAAKSKQFTLKLQAPEETHFFNNVKSV